MMKLSVLMLAALVASGSALAQGRPDLVEQSLRGGGAQFVPGELLVQFKPGTSAQAQDSAIAFLRASRKELVLPASRRSDSKGDLHVLSLPPGLAVTDAFRSMSQLSDVDFAEPNWIYQHQAIANDTYATNGSLWGMASSSPQGGLSTNAFGSGASTAWQNNKTDCGGVYIGIIDEGYMFTHEDLASNAGVNPGETPGDGIDNDGNGYVDDVRGWNFDGSNNVVFGGSGDDHGTHVAGTIAGAGGNSKGVAGVCWSGVNLLGAKFLGSNGGTTVNAIKAVDYFTVTKQQNNLVLPATNNSWGGGGYSQALKDAIDRAGAADILFIAAAGNSKANCDRRDCYPAEYTSPNVIAVAAIDRTGALASYSNFGAATVHIGAPGSAIWSTVPTASGASGYASYNGTSMATPHVTGAVALFKARNPAATAAQIKSAILGAGKPTTSLAGKTITGDRLDVSGF